MTSETDHTLLQMKMELTRLRLDVATLRSSSSCGNVLKFFILAVLLVTSCALGRVAHLILAKL